MGAAAASISIFGIPRSPGPNPSWALIPGSSLDAEFESQTQRTLASV